MSSPLSSVRSRALYLAVVQFVFISTWTIYVVFLPELLQHAGIEKTWLPRILIADQLLIAGFDLAFGIAASRGMQRYGRIAPVLLGVSLASCFAFMLMPQAGSAPALLLGLTFVWVITSSALRAPLYALLSRHAATPERTALAAMMTLGMAGAGMIAPWLGTQLKGISPALPFALSSLTLAALVLPLAAAERAAGLKTDSPAEHLPPAPLGSLAFFVLLLAAALGFQVFFNLAAAPAYLRHYAASDLAWLMPLFWVGVAGGSVLASISGGARPPHVTFFAGCLLAAIAAAIFGTTGSALLLPAAQLLGGIGWGLALCKAFAIAERFVPAPRSAAMVGALFSILALATVSRITLNVAGLAEPASALPLPLWLLAAAGMGVALLRAAPRQKP